MQLQRRVFVVETIGTRSQKAEILIFELTRTIKYVHISGTFVLRHFCPFPQISLLRNPEHRKVKIFYFPQKLEFFNFEKKSILQKNTFDTRENFFGS